MTSRRKARECILKALYLMEMSGEDPVKAYSDIYQNWTNSSFDEEYAERLITAVEKNIEQIDSILSNTLDNWDIKRIAIIDKNILRIAICEILYFDDIPPRVAMDEAIEIAKLYSTPDSGKFVNGILDKVVRTTEKLV